MATEQIVVFPPTETGEIIIQKGENSSILAGFIPTGLMPEDITTAKLVVILPATLSTSLLDANDNIIGVADATGNPVIHSTSPPRNAVSIPYASASRVCSLLASDASLCDASGKFRLGGFQADGVTFNPSFFETSSSSSLNPGGVARTPIVIGATGGGGVTGIITRVADTVCTSAQTDATKKFAWELTCDPTHYTSANHARTQFTSAPLEPRKRYLQKYSFRWNNTNTAAAYAQAETSVPPSDLMHECLIWQIHQFNSAQPWETNQNGGQPMFSLLYFSGRYVFFIRRCKDNMGSTQTNGLGNPYKAYDNEDAAQTDVTYFDLDPTKYTDFTFEFYLDERDITEGGRGYLKVRSGGKLMVDYVGPTLQPLRAIDKSPRIVEVTTKFGMYFYNTPYETVATNTVAASIIAAPVAYNPFRTCKLRVREVTLLTD